MDPILIAQEDERQRDRTIASFFATHWFGLTDAQRASRERLAETFPAAWRLAKQMVRGEVDLDAAELNTDMPQ